MRIGQWISVIALFISLYILWQIRQVLLLVFAAVVLATILNQLVRFLSRFRIKRGIAIAITLILLLILVFSFFAIILPRLSTQVVLFADVLPRGIARLQSWFVWLQAEVPGEVLGNDGGLQNLTQELQAWVTRIAGNFFNLLTGSVAAVANFVLFLALTVMLLANPLQYRRIFEMGFPAFYRPRIEHILNECEVALTGWFKGALISMAVIALVSYIGLLILQVPLPLVNALIAGVFEFVPNVGPTLATVPPVLLALLDSPWKAVAVLVFYFLIQQFESFVLTPFVMKREVDLMPLFTILSVVVFSSFFGFLGLFLAVPLLIVFQIVLKEVLVKDVMNRWQDDRRDREPAKIPAESTH